MSGTVGHDLGQAVNLLKKGEVVGIPTETVYGLAGLCSRSRAIAQIYKVKGRPLTNPLILHSHSLEAARPWLGAVAKEAERLADCFWPGPLTLLFPKNARLSPQITAGLAQVALRVPAHAVAQQLLKALEAPLAAPSANLSNHLSPTCTEHVRAQLGDQIPYILEGGPCEIGVESSILGFEGTTPVLYRTGAISVEALEEVLRRPVRPVIRPRSAQAAVAPGMQALHYAPCLPLYFGETNELLAHHGKHRVALLRFSEPHSTLPASQQRVLSPKKDLKEAANKLFTALHELEKMEVSCILAEPVPNLGLGLAINDRLQRASVQSKGTALPG